jgi:hypothetical protein
VTQGVALRPRTQARLAQVCEITEGPNAGRPLPQAAYYDLNPSGSLHWSNQEFVRHIDPDSKKPVTTNLTPRKCLGFKTPFQALLAELGKDVQIRFS